MGVIGDFPLVPLQSLAEIGPDARDIHDGFNLRGGSTIYEAFYGHNTSTVTTLSQEPNHAFTPLARAKRNRTLRDATLLWSRAGRVLVAERLRLNNARLVSVLSSRRVLSTTWWPVAVIGSGKADEIERILVLWFNSTWGLLSLIARRVETEGPWIKMKKPILESLPVLNPNALSPEQRSQLSRDYAAIASLNLAPLPEIAVDDVRSRIDEAIMRALGITQDFQPLRRMLSVEPVIAGENVIQ
jgi:hypothetical protein